MLQELRKKHEENAKKIIRLGGVLEGWKTALRTDWEKFIVDIAVVAMEEPNRRESEDLGILEATIEMMAWLAKEVSMLKNIIARMTVSETITEKEVNSIKDWKTEYDEMLKFIKNWVEDRKREEEEKERYR